MWNTCWAEAELAFPVDLFRLPDYRRYLTARFVVSVALQLIGVAVGWQVYALTEDPLSLGVVGLVQFLPAFLLTLPGGHAADRFDRRSVLAVSVALELLAAILLTALALLPVPPLTAIYAVLALLLSLAALAVMGAADMVSVVIRQTLVQLRTPDEMRGRVSAVNFVFIGASNELGEFESGITAALFGTVPAVVIGGLGTITVAALWAWRFPELRRFDRFR